MAATVVLLSIGILWVASGAVGPMVDGAVKGLGNVVSSIGNVVASPDATEPPATHRIPIESATTVAAIAALIGSGSARRRSTRR